mgnify:CR=1 FL=1
MYFYSPLPLSQEEESSKITLLESGDQRAKAELVEHNLRLVVYIAKKFEGSGADGANINILQQVRMQHRAINFLRTDSYFNVFKRIRFFAEVNLDFIRGKHLHI